MNLKFQEQECIKIDEECTAIGASIEKLLAENARAAIEQDEYNFKYNGYVSRYNKLQEIRQELNAEIAIRKGKRNLIEVFFKELKIKKG
jgi:hypothetical protein